MLSVYHHAVDEADEHPLRDEPRLGVQHALEELQIRSARVVAGDRVVGQLTQPTVARRVLERADADVRGRHARQDRARQGAGLAQDRLAGGDDGQRARGRDAQGVHRLADDRLTQHRAEHGLAVAAARERRPARALQVEVATPPRDVDELAEQQRAAVAQPRGVAAELVAGVGHRDRHRTRGNGAAREHVEIEGDAQLRRERLVVQHELRLRRRHGLPRHTQPFELVGECVLAALTAGVGQVLAVSRLGRPGLVLVVAVRAQPVAHAVGERRQAVAVPLLERVAGHRQAGSPALVGQDGDLVDQVWVQRPAAGDEPGDVPGVLAVEPDHDVLEPLPQVVTQLGVQAGCRLPGPREQRVVA